MSDEYGTCEILSDGVCPFWPMAEMSSCRLGHGPTTTTMWDKTKCADFVDSPQTWSTWSGGSYADGYPPFGLCKRGIGWGAISVGCLTYRQSQIKLPA